MKTLAKFNNNTCSICYSEFEQSDISFRPVSLSCGHEYCSTCWGYYIRDKVLSDGPNCVFTKCPQLRCNVAIPHSMFLAYLPDEPYEDGINYREKYLLWHCKQFTDHNKSIKWCPQKNCNYISERSDYCLKETVICKCGNSFCFSCGKEDHVPASCKVVEAWLNKEQSDSENLTWIKANTKPCPKCSSNIEKNQGCMHMTCKKCNHAFCWLCLTEWSKHGSGTGGYYACNIYDKLKSTDKDL